MTERKTNYRKNYRKKEIKKDDIDALTSSCDRCGIARIEAEGGVALLQ